MSDAPTDAPEFNDDGSDGVEKIQMLKTGRVRIVTDDGTSYLLKRPNLGEYDDLTQAWDHVALELEDLQAAYNAKLKGPLAAEGERIGKLPPGEEREQALAAHRREVSKAARELTKAAEQVRLGWWRQVFRTLSMGTGPRKSPSAKAWPTWVHDPNLPHQMRQHWRLVPLDLG